MPSGVSAISVTQAPRRRQLPEEVAAYVRELIISGQVKPGEFLRIEPIAEALGISNTPVREGLLSLRSEGFVRLAPRRGFVVAPFSRQDVRDLFWAQAQLGGELAARAAKNITPDVLERLDDLNVRYEAAVAAGDEEAVAELGHLFHREINLAANSQRLALLLGSVVKHLPNRFYANIEGQVGETQGDHPAITDALRNRDSRKARSLMEKHILKGGERLIATLQARGLWKDEQPA
jgi:DNA-binding GntR family transcriptional regulator